MPDLGRGGVARLRATSNSRRVQRPCHLPARTQPGDSQLAALSKKPQPQVGPGVYKAQDRTPKTDADRPTYIFSRFIIYIFKLQSRYFRIKSHLEFRLFYQEANLKYWPWRFSANPTQNPNTFPRWLLVFLFV